jgi:hypothetical protein
VTDPALQNVVLQLTETAERLADLERLVKDLGTDIRQQAERTARLQALEEALAALTARVAEVLPDEQGAPRTYAPRPAPRWWNLTGQAREAEIGRLRGFVEHVYRPGFGHQAARLRPCWPSHDLCLYCLDIAAELHAVLYLQARRTISLLNGQAEYATRVLPALADLMAAETRSGCQHHSAPVNGIPVPVTGGPAELTDETGRSA